ncbi:MAG: alpha-2-macroglobulin family protein [Bacteroidota bacterium]
MQVYFDRAIYRPGQKVFFKGIATKNDKGTISVVPNVYFSVYTKDANNKGLKEYRLKTNEFGSFTADTDLSKTGITGTYELFVREDDDKELDPAYDHKNNEHPFWDYVDFGRERFTFKVEDYKRPTFDITFKPVTQAYMLNDSITVTGTAKSFSGAAVSGATVAYRVRSLSHSSYRYYNFDEEEEDYEDGTLVDTDEITTNAEGNFKITFKAEVPDSNYNEEKKPDYDFIIYADVTDVNGETHTQHFKVTAGSHLLYPEVDTQSYTVDASKGTQVTFSALNINDSPMKAAGTIKIYKVPADRRVLGKRPWAEPELQTIPEEEFIKAFPHMPYGKEVKERQPGAKAYFEQQVNTGTQKAITLKDFKGWPSGEYEIEFTVTDSLGREEKTTVNFDLERKSDTFLPDNKVFTFATINKNPAKDGYVAVEIRTALPVIYANVLAAANNKLIYNKPVVVKNGRALIKIPVQKNKEGDMALRLDFIWNNELYYSSFTTSYSIPVTPVEIEMESTTSRLAPGGDQTWKFTIKNGKKREAEVLAGMYDAALDQIATKEWELLTNHTYSNNNTPYTNFETYGTSYGGYNIYKKYKEPSIAKGDNFYMYGFDIIKSSNKYIDYVPKRQLTSSGDVTVTGIVSDNIGPIPGVTVTIAGTSEGTVTDLDGKYVIYAAKGEKIAFSYLGMETQKFDIPANGILNVELEDEIENIIVDKYRTQTQASNSNAVTTITSKTIEGRPNVSYIQTLQGQVPGLNITSEKELESVAVGMNYTMADSTSVEIMGYAVAGDFDKDMDGTYDTYMNENYWAMGSAGGDNNVSIKGASVINGKANALFIIDGVPVGEEDVKQLKARDILSFNVLTKPADIAPYGDRGKNGVVLIITQQGMAGLQQVKARKNFNETAFFIPQLHTDKKGNISFTFTSPEALTEWKLRLLAHNKQAVSGYFEKKFFTQKDLMVVPNMPRFLRETDTITISAKITNMTIEPKTGTALLQLFDAITLQPVDAAMANTNSAKSFTLNANGNTTVTWTIIVPTGLQGVQYKVLAKAGNFTDGEENILPVLTNSMLVTESLPLWVRENTTKTYTFDNFKNNTSTTLRHHSVTLEYTSNPAWLALKALPYLMEFEHECAEQVFSRFYANSIATHIIESNTKIAEVFAAWRKDGAPSRLEQDEELKSVILAETPWLLDNQSEEEQKNRMALLFDLDKMKAGLDANFKKLQDKQAASGGFPWFEGSPENEYITRHIVAGFGHLAQLDVLNRADSIRVAGITKTAVPYIDNAFLSRESQAKKLRGKKDNFRMPYPYSDLHYLYTRSFYLKQYPTGDSLTAAIKPYIKDIKQKWTDYTLYEKGMAALVLHRYNETATAQKVLTYLKGSSANNEEIGMHWLDNTPGWWWYQAPVETQALLIEAFAEVGNDTKSVDAMKVWLIKQKQNKNWPTTKATTEAVYALLMQGTDWLSVQGGTTFTLGDKTVLDKKLAEAGKEAGTGYIKLQWKPEEISKDMATLTVENKGAVPGYGGFYWQYFENLDKIKPAQEGLMNIKKELYRKNSTAEEVTLEPITEKTPVKVGDVVTMRLVLTLKEDMEYVHLKDMRAAAFEPVDVLSGYHYKDGLGYYQSTRDAATNFFFSYINRGTYVLEYDVRVNNAGQFSNGITTIQSMYAPEFSGHTQGVRVRTE